MQTPTPDELRIESDLIAAKLPDDNGGPNDLKLAARAESSAALVASLTFRLIDPVNASVVEGATFEDVPAGLVPVARRAVALMVERLLVTGAPGFAEKIATGRRVRSISAGPWSESYFAPGEFARRGAAQGRPPMDADDALDAALWALATQEARDYFIAEASGKQLPAGAVTEFDYRRTARGAMPFRTGLGPDGF